MVETVDLAPDMLLLKLWLKFPIPLTSSKAEMTIVETNLLKKKFCHIKFLYTFKTVFFIFLISIY